MMRALRGDRMTYAVQGFIEEKLGPKFVENCSVEFAKSFEESGVLNYFSFPFYNVNRFQFFISAITIVTGFTTILTNVS